MPLNADALGELMYNAAAPFTNIPTPEDPEEVRLNYFKAQAAAIVSYLIANGTVVTTCGAGAGTGVIS